MSNLRTALYSRHLARSARMVPFGGWDMPVQYAGVIEEHRAVRGNVGVFDISHMARVRVEGADALSLIENVFTNAVGTMAIGQVRYGLVCKDDGGILDDILVTRFPTHFDLCVNASNREKILAWICSKATAGVSIVDQTFETTMIAVQGPNAHRLLAGMFDDDVSKLKYYHARETRYGLHPVTVSRTGYTGEDGFEVIAANEVGLKFWDEIMDRGATPSGLGARDTLRLEAAMPLYGHELNEEIDPLTAGLGWAVKLDKGDFIGRDAIRAVNEQAPEKRRVRIGLLLEGKRAAREGSRILSTDGTPIGVVTSGSYVPHLDRSIAMGYVPMTMANQTAMIVDVRGTKIPATRVPLPFYQRTKS